ncbi:MAG: SRPBCC family protein [Chloroflexota bacterium]
MNPFETLLGAVQVAGALIFSPLIRGWYNRWGADRATVERALPGDELVPVSHMGYTRAILIHAPAQRVWSWLVQMGQGRGGLYSYDGLENLAGCDIHTVERIVPELQTLQVGDVIRLGPKGYPCFGVALVDPERALALVSLEPKSEQRVEYTAQPGKAYSIATWQFVLEPQGEAATRLLVRERLAYSPDMAWIWRLTEPVAFVMERKMLLGIKRRAEQA